jgi:hypothetical protein
MKKPTLPFLPEPEAQLKARYAAALDPVYDPHEVIDGKVKRPGQQRKHVFDTEDGYRLIISRERLKGAPPVLHISVSLDVSPAAWAWTAPRFSPCA